MSTEFISTLLVNTAVFSALFAVMLLARRLLAGRLSAALRYALWAVVAVKLLIPFGFESPWRLPAWTEIRGTELIAAAQTASPDAKTAADSVLAAGDLTMPAVSDLYADPVHGPEIMLPETETPPEPQNGPTLPWTAWALMIWGAGAAAAAGWLLAGMAGLRRHIRRGGREVPRVFAAVLDDCRRELGIGRAIGVCFLPGAAIPAITGILRPTLLLPGSLREAGARELRPILLHELTHYRHGDLWVMGLQNVLTAIYWFNPLTWWCFALMRRDMETLCDQRVLALLDGERQRYVHAILSYTSPGSGGRFRAALGLGDGHARLERRIREMFGRRRSGRRTRTAAVALAAAMLAAGLLTACQPTPEDPIVADKNNGKMEQVIKATPIPQDTPQASAPAPTPVHYDETYPGAEDTVTIHIDADVTTPTGNMPVVKVAPHFIDMDQIRAMAEVLFDGNTAYEPQVAMSKDELEAEILHLQQFISDNDAMLDYYSGNQEVVNEVKTMFEKRIADYRSQYEGAPDSVEIRETDWTFRPKAYYKDMAIYGDNLEGEDEQSLYLRKEYYESQTLELVSTVEDYHAYFRVMNLDSDYRITHSVYFCLGSGLNAGNMPEWSESDSQPMTMTRDEAVAMVSDALSRMGIGSMRLSQFHAYGKSRKVQPADELNMSDEKAAIYEAAGEGAEPPKDNADEAGEDVYTYIMTFTPVYEGAAAADMGIFNEVGGGQNDYGPSYQYEELRVTVQNGVISTFIWTAPMDQTEVENENVAVLTLDEAMAAFKRQMQVEYTLSKVARYSPDNEDYEEYMSQIQSGDVYITDIRMSLMRMPVKDRLGEYRMIPVWTFFGHEQVSCKDEEMMMPGPNVKQPDSVSYPYAVINALDGSIIDLTQGY